MGIEVGIDGDTAGGWDITTSGMPLKILPDKIITGTMPLNARHLRHYEDKNGKL